MDKNFRKFLSLYVADLQQRNVVSVEPGGHLAAPLHGHAKGRHVADDGGSVVVARKLRHVVGGRAREQVERNVLCAQVGLHLAQALEHKAKVADRGVQKAGHKVEDDDEGDLERKGGEDDVRRKIAVKRASNGSAQ